MSALLFRVADLLPHGYIRYLLEGFHGCMHFLAQIEKKRDGKELTADAIASFVRDFTEGKIPDYQVAALLMAIFFRGMSATEMRALTVAMRDSGEVLKFPEDSRPLADKHSTGGIGDKVSLPLAPLLACLGFRVPMISGRGLGITGGTLDKLEAIPGFTTDLDPARLVDQVQSIGVAIAAQTERMVPADKRLYALRDVTGTVPSIPLITASILSKKLAEGLHALVMDVKFGTGAFMQTQARAGELAWSISSLARSCGLRTRALLTNMNVPLGRAAGNWLEVKEAIGCLDGRGPDDLRELVVECAAHLLLITNRATNLPEARRQAGVCLDSGQPRRKWDELLAAQGTDPDTFHRKIQRDHTAQFVTSLNAPRTGFVSHCDARIVGEVIRDLGGGRVSKEAAVDRDVGLDRIVKPGDRIEAGQPLCRIHARNASEATEAARGLTDAFTISQQEVKPAPLIADIIEQ